MIEIRNLSKRFPTSEAGFLALENINLSIADGEIFGIIGISGAGKSTLVRCMNLLERPTEGSVLIDGTDITELDTRSLLEFRRHTGMIFQKFNLLMQRSILDNVMLPLEICGMPKRARREKALRLLDLVGLTDQQSKYPAQLSGGQQQRVSIARALANDPKVLLCDEPTSALDPFTTSSILKLLKQINEKLGVTIVIITHQIDVVRSICDRVAVIDNASIAEQGKTAEVFKNPSSTITKQLLGRVDWNA